MLLLHGWPQDWRLWREVMPRLADAGLRAVAPHLRGCGRTTRATAGYDLHTLADDATGPLDGLGWESTGRP